MGYELARSSIFVVPDGPARYAKRPIGPCLDQRSGTQADKAWPVGHDVPPRPIRPVPAPVLCRVMPAQPVAQVYFPLSSEEADTGDTTP